MLVLYFYAIQNLNLDRFRIIERKQWVAINQNDMAQNCKKYTYVFMEWTNKKRIKNRGGNWIFCLDVEIGKREILTWTKNVTWTCFEKKCSVMQRFENFDKR